METLYKGNTMSKKRTMNELRQTKDAYYQVPRSTEPVYKANSKQLNHHDIIYRNSDIQTPSEWLAANALMESEPATRCMEAYATYYVNRLTELELV
jgi:hypothetical protein